MKKAFSAPKLKTISSLAAGVALASAFWFASTPVAKGVQRTPAEMIQAQLPANVTIANASDTQLLDAVCKSVRKSPKEAALIVRTAAGARQKIRAEILCMAVRCTREQHAFDCTWVLDVVRQWIKQEPALANQLTESISQCAPDCREMLQNLGAGRGEGEGEGNFTNPPANINPPPGSVGSGAGAGTNQCLVCHNGHEISIPCDQTPKFLSRHRGDVAGPCQATPVTNP